MKTKNKVKATKKSANKKKTSKPKNSPKPKAKAPATDDWDVVAHVIKVETNKHFVWGGDKHKLLAVYLNRYGHVVGCLCSDSKTGDIRSMDPFLYEEFLNFEERFK